MALISYHDRGPSRTLRGYPKKLRVSPADAGSGSVVRAVNRAKIAVQRAVQDTAAPAPVAGPVQRSTPRGRSPERQAQLDALRGRATTRIEDRAVAQNARATASRMGRAFSAGYATSVFSTPSGARVSDRPPSNFSQLAGRWLAPSISRSLATPRDDIAVGGGLPSPSDPMIGGAGDGGGFLPELAGGELAGEGDANNMSLLFLGAAVFVAFLIFRK